MVPYWEKAAHSIYNMFSLYNYLIGNLVFPNLGFWSGNFFLITKLPDHYLSKLFHPPAYNDIER